MCHFCGRSACFGSIFLNARSAEPSRPIATCRCFPPGSRGGPAAAAFEAHGRETRARMTRHDCAAREEADERERAGELVERLATRLRDVLLDVDALLRLQQRLGLGLRLGEHLGVGCLRAAARVETRRVETRRVEARREAFVGDGRQYRAGLTTGAEPGGPPRAARLGDDVSASSPRLIGPPGARFCAEAFHSA